ncbi:GyrI-like domain-containing protein [Maritalea porphyrae]|jgi:hypothetical protein|uniref:GyrI-like domain-containing protein n=1 Tax=Maritalea porphyrae TaxID=880732 RepID=UPI0022AE8156|nr:GyrI-like domain-containing protein [Maritalea porphyrae]MCZ4273838.1 GyrI-like domain-containing protein [Maritalea porphyrae]
MAFEDLKLRLKELYQPPSDEFSQVLVPNLPFAMLDGAGDPTAGEYEAGLKWLFAAIQPIRKEAKIVMGKDFIEPPLETLWWADDMKDLIEGNRDRLKWRLMIPLPDWLEEDAFALSLKKVAEQRGQRPPKGMRMERFEEGLCVQIMHIGPNEEVRPTLDRLYHDYLPAQELEAHGHYHEIYLGDPKRTAPEKRKTIVRQPVRELVR